MSYLLYCILDDFKPPAPSGLLGIEDHPVSVLRGDVLGAVVSQAETSELTPDISRILTFEKVVEAYHESRTIIPMRYGSVFFREPDIVRFLDQHTEKYRDLLRHLEGCSEMGVRVLLQETASDISRPPADAPRLHEGAQKPISGYGYLAARRAHYEVHDRLALEKKSMVELCRSAFEGLFVDFKAELPTAVLSLYFLVPGGSIGAFKEAFRKFHTAQKKNMLLSGPWPPYNFV